MFNEMSEVAQEKREEITDIKRAIALWLEFQALIDTLHPEARKVVDRLMRFEQRYDN